jgi:hypothetical protein
MIDTRLAGRTVIVTGANNPHGIGAATRVRSRPKARAFCSSHRSHAVPIDPGRRPVPRWCGRAGAAGPSTIRAMNDPSGWRAARREPARARVGRTLGPQAEGNAALIFGPTRAAPGTNRSVRPPGPIGAQRHRVPACGDGHSWPGMCAHRERTDHAPRINTHGARRQRRDRPGLVISYRTRTPLRCTRRAMIEPSGLAELFDLPARSPVGSCARTPTTCTRSRLPKGISFSRCTGTAGGRRARSATS